MTIRNQYPKARPQAIYNVLNSRPELPTNSVFSRATEGTYVSRDGTVKTAAIDEPRFNYDPETGEFLGLLLEDQAKNGCSSTDTAGATKEGLTSAGWNYTFMPDSPTGGEYLHMVRENQGSATNWAIAIDYSGLNLNQNEQCIMSFWIRSPNVTQTNLRNPDKDSIIIYVTPEWKRVYAGFKYGTQSMGLLYMRLDRGGDLPTGSIIDICNAQAEVLPNGSDWQNVVPSDASSYCRNAESSYSSFSTREADNFSIATSANYDNGFSLLLDTEVGDAEYIYKLATADDTETVSLDINSNVLEWKIGGVSNQTQGAFPQVGFVRGRFRTVSSLGASDGNDQTNYLYTTGVSFPTVTAVPADSQKLLFGVPQSLKAVYVWPEQLNATGAVNLIKGIENVIPFPDDISDALIFAYNTDPDSEGNTTVSWPSIQPNVNATWALGDGSPDVGVTDGATVTHNYPYPGVYKVQVTASGDQGDDGFSKLKFNDIDNAVYEVIQWAPEYRVDAPGLGFTGDDLVSILEKQGACERVPQYKYTDLENINNAFYLARNLDINNWNWVPTELQECTGITQAFWGAISKATTQDLASFPQLKTSNKLLNAASTFRDKRLTGFVDSDGIATNIPITNASSVTSFLSCFYSCRLANSNLVVDTSAATSVSRMFGDNRFVTTPYFDTSLVQDFSYCFAINPELVTFTALNLGECVYMNNAFDNCPKLASFPTNIDTSKVENFDYTWQFCKSLATLPSLDYSSATNVRQTWKSCETMTTWGAPATANSFSQVSGFTATWQNCYLLQEMPLINTSGIKQEDDKGMDSVWQNCSALTNFPLIDTTNCKTLQTCWSGCSSLTEFPDLITSSCKDFSLSWRDCSSLTQFPLLDFTAAENLSNTWNLCSGLTAFPEILTGTVTNFSGAWKSCSSLTAFPLLDFSSGLQCYTTWQNCTSLETFPANAFNNMGVLEDYAFGLAFRGCALSAASIQNILESLDANGSEGIDLDIDSGTNAAKSTWTSAAVAAFDSLEAKGWTITYNP